MSSRAKLCGVAGLPGFLVSMGAQQPESRVSGLVDSASKHHPEEPHAPFFKEDTLNYRGPTIMM